MRQYLYKSNKSLIPTTTSIPLDFLKKKKDGKRWELETLGAVCSWRHGHVTAKNN